MYVRHRDRMIRESIFADLQDTMIACGWLAGTTGRPLLPLPPASGSPAVVTTAPGDVLELLEGHPVVLVDAFPEADPSATSDGNRTEPNTFAMNTGLPGEPIPVELGNLGLYEQPHTFNFAFWAVSDAAAVAVFNDLADRYKGNILDGDAISLYNYLADDPTTPVVRMDVESFRYTRDTDTVTASDVHLYFAELVVVDLIEP